MACKKTDGSYLLHDYNNDEQQLLSMWQNLYIKKQDNCRPSEYSQCLRGFLQQIDIAGKLKMLNSNTVGEILHSYSSTYADVIDETNENLGMNNFSTDALSLAKLKSMEIEKWNSELKAEDIFCKFGKVERKSEDTNGFFKKLSENWRTNKTDFSKLPIEEAQTFIQSFSKPALSQQQRVFPVQRSTPDFVKKVSTANTSYLGAKRKCPSPDLNEPEQKQKNFGSFRTAREELIVNSSRPKDGKQTSRDGIPANSNSSLKKHLGPRRGNITGRFVSPLISKDKEESGSTFLQKEGTFNIEDEILKNIDSKMIDLITSEIMDHGPPITWDDIAGLEFAKKTIKEIVVLPILRPDIFTGLRGPPKGLLLFGPPGTGKTLIGKCIACQSKSTFFSISASSLTSKWIGDGEKMVRALFAVARCHQPAVIFIDEIDSILTQRNDSEHESSRRMKTEILVQLDGATTNKEDKILVVGATNRPQELDEAARRRLVKRLYIPLPELEARKHIIINLLQHQAHSLSEENINDIGNKTSGYSGADMANLCKEAALGPIRCLSYEDIQNISADFVRPISYNDFLDALHQVKASVSDAELTSYVEWNLKFGSNSTNSS